MTIAIFVDLLDILSSGLDYGFFFAATLSSVHFLSTHKTRIESNRFRLSVSVPNRVPNKGR